MEFKITGLTCGRKMFGRTIITARAKDENETLIIISYCNHPLIDLSKKSVKIMLENEYRKVVLKPKHGLSVGDVI